MLRDVTKADLERVVDFAYRLNSITEHRCKAFPADYDSIYQQFNWMLNHQHDRLLVLEENRTISGFLALLVEPQEKYLEAVGGVFAEVNYDTVAKVFYDYLAENYQGYSLDAAYPADNVNATRFMGCIGAKMVDYDYELRLKREQFQEECLGATTVIQLTDRYHESFIKFHDTHHPDVFWTGQKLLKNLNKFRIHVVRQKEKITASVVTNRVTNEIFFMAVADQKQMLGTGKAILQQAVKDAFIEGARELQAMVERDKRTKLQLFQGLGFVKTDTCLTYTVEL